MNNIFHKEVRDGLFILCDKRHSPDGDPASLSPGSPTGNSYLVIGNDRALLFDLAIDNKNMKQYASELAKRSVQLVLSHAHVDHIYHITDFDKVWLHPDDEKLLREGAAFQKGIKNCPPLSYLFDGDIIDLGGRILDVIHIPGHTDGSIVLLDRQTRTLLGGDTVARHLLHGMHTKIAPEKISEDMEKLKSLPFDVIYCAHDRCALPKEHLSLIQEVIRRCQSEGENKSIPMLCRMRTFSIGTLEDLYYCDIAEMVAKDD